eukprot:CAMPEP_0182872528 /NCGR_PEP_ID=MMETSP0034_2-20130328/11764_1 /TAXON_ID=156128 /ORGANISM="Nephroselmis pyriformis, Strain CCMP717" /LENGTH=79 /DNA_ID=CAMNT_0025005117 /DNA_START=172 /DNA_END=408 /DNA_ORIENTATION=+
MPCPRSATPGPGRASCRSPSAEKPPPPPQTRARYQSQPPALSPRSAPARGCRGIEGLSAPSANARASPGRGEACAAAAG